MKQLLLLTTLLFSFTSFAGDQGEVIINYKAQLNTFDINHDYIRGDEGEVIVDLIKNKITLNLVGQYECPQTSTNMVCIALESENYEVSLPLVSVSTDWCGSTKYTAELDESPVDGLHQILEVYDYSTITCRIFVALEHLTEVNYKTFNPWVNKWTESSFKGEKLVPNYTAL